MCCLGHLMIWRRFIYTLGLVLVVSTIAFSLLVNAEGINACECDESTSADERFSEASAVFLGRVVKIYFEDWPFDIDSALVPPDEPLTVEFRVRSVWKGEVSEIMSVSTARSEPCGYPFGMHGDYLVYADGEQGALEVLACGGTKRFDEAQEDLISLGEGDSPVSSERRVIKPATLDCFASAQSARNQLISWPLGLIAGIAWVGLRKRRRRR